MGKNRIKNLPEPAAWDDPVTRSFLTTQLLVFSEREKGKKSLSRNVDSSFTANGQIDMKEKRIINLPRPVDRSDPVTISYLTERLTALSVHLIDLSKKEKTKPIISVHAEEQGTLFDGNFEFSFGNGSNGRSHRHGGYCMSAPGRIIRGSLTVLKGNKFLEEEIKINLVVNDEEKTDYSLIKKTGDACSCIIFPQPLELKRCDVINFITRTGNNDVKNAYLSILIELDL